MTSKYAKSWMLSTEEFEEKSMEQATQRHWSAFHAKRKNVWMSMCADFANQMPKEEEVAPATTAPVSENNNAVLEELENYAKELIQTSLTTNCSFNDLTQASTEFTMLSAPAIGAM